MLQQLGRSHGVGDERQESVSRLLLVFRTKLEEFDMSDSGERHLRDDMKRDRKCKNNQYLMYPTMKKTIDLFVSLENDFFAMIWIIKNILKSDWFISYRIVPNDERYKKYQFCLKNFFRYVGFRRTTTWGRPQLKIDQFVSYHTLLIIQKLKVGVTGGSSCDTLNVAKWIDF